MHGSLFTVEEAVETLTAWERGALVPTTQLEETLRTMHRELAFRADYQHVPPGYSSTGLQRLAERIAAVLREVRQQRHAWEKEQEEGEQQ